MKTGGKQETKQQKEARKKKEQEKRDKEAGRVKQVQGTAAARDEANKEAQERIPKKKAKKQKPADESTEESVQDSSEEKEPGLGSAEEDEEEDGDLPAGDGRCGVTGCDLGAGDGKNNCARHKKAADEQKAAAKEAGAQRQTAQF